jgi:hypothetical protein
MGESDALERAPSNGGHGGENSNGRSDGRRRWVTLLLTRGGVWRRSWTEKRGALGREGGGASREQGGEEKGRRPSTETFTDDLAVGELEHGLQRGVELLSAGKVSLRWRGSVQAKGFARGRSVPIYTETAGVRCATSGEEKRAGGSSGLGAMGGEQRV